MKYTLLLIGIFGISLCSFGQGYIDSLPVDESGWVTYNKTIDATGKKDDLFVKGKLSMVDMFKSSKAVIQSEDKAEGYIIGKGNFIFGYHYSYAKRKAVETEKQLSTQRAEFTLKLFFKDNKAKVVVTDITILDPSFSFLNKKLDKMTLELIRTGQSGDAKAQAFSATLISQIRGVQDRVNDMIAVIESSLLKKSETDF